MILIVCFRARYGCYLFLARSVLKSCPDNDIFWNWYCETWALRHFSIDIYWFNWYLVGENDSQIKLYQLPDNMVRVKVYFLSLHMYCITSSSSCVSYSSVGTFARALDCSSSVRQPSLHMSAAAASRDITLVRYTWKRPWVESASHHRWKVYGRVERGGGGSSDNQRKCSLCTCVCLCVCGCLCVC